MAEAKRLRSGWNQKLREAIFESRRLKREAEQVSAAWMERKTGFLNCMKAFEDELDDLKRENERLTQSQRTARGETSKNRDIIKQAVNEATVVKEALEIARGENSRLKDSLKEIG
ncbi:hypothetical protein HPP92_015842 [Vanilla planifolia]|uniref:Uncharacterized protein n=1 Tax=Vanilla planifolia TaxID=51239 RepID=A0A835UTM5_VANPL|nr:hypothetical protein HPP92_027242 [Vanilla planifolia]KAG0471296.1 hypothetical protein HPP92_015842 [Vanilla planifolia]